MRDRGLTGDYKVIRSSDSESLSASDGCDWSTEVSDVRRCQSMQRLVCQQTQLELDASGGGRVANLETSHTAVWLVTPLTLLLSFNFHVLCV